MSNEGLNILDTKTNKSSAINSKESKITDFAFSPNGNYICTFERFSKNIPNHANVKIYRINDLFLVKSFTHKNPDNWKIQFTQDEKYYMRMNSSNAVEVYPSNGADLCSKLELEGLTQFSCSPGMNPSVACFVKERSGKPAIVRVYGLLSFNYPLSNKTFFKADEAEFKWNPIGTNLLVKTCTDKTSQSYYGETNLYYLSSVGNYDCRVDMSDHIGPVHEIAWHPKGNEFIVVYGNVPAKACVYDSRANKVFDFGKSAKNYVRYSPQGRLILFAGFGNLAGMVEIWDRSSLTVVSKFQEDLAVYCEFLQDGEHILAATLSPRLRVDNRFRIRKYTGDIIWQYDFKELYQVMVQPGYTLNDEAKMEVIVQKDVNGSSNGKVEEKKAYIPPHLRNKTVVGAAPNGTNKGKAKPAASEGNDLQKKIAGVERKLKQIEKLKEKIRNGEQLELNQLEKISNENQLIEELDKLKLQA